MYIGKQKQFEIIVNGKAILKYILSKLLCLLMLIKM